VPDETTPDGRPVPPSRDPYAADDIETAEVIVDAPSAPTSGEPIDVTSTDVTSTDVTRDAPVPGPFAAAAPPPPPHPESVMSPWPPASGPFGGSEPVEPVAPSTARGGRGRSRQLLIGALAGGLVGALVASGVFLATDDNGGTTTRVVEQPAQSITRPSNTINGKLDVAGIIAKVEPAVVAITTDGGPDNGGAAGTGFVITSDGYIATNNHVIEGASKISVAFNDGTTKPANLVGHDPATDLAVLKVSATGLPSVTLGNSDKVQVGDDVVAIGNALALEGGLSVTQGIISGTNRQVSTDAGSQLFGMLQTDAAINPGNSGGPLVNAQGQVIGINTAIANPSEAQNIGFAIPVSAAQPIIADLQAGRKPAFLGVATVTVKIGRAHV
jgi:serine protease Do